VPRDFAADPRRKLTAGEHEIELARLGKERRKTMTQYEREMRALRARDYFHEWSDKAAMVFWREQCSGEYFLQVW
jgi:hypothetical protein